MIRTILFLFLLQITTASFSQRTDIISVTQKNGKHLASFFPGVDIDFKTVYGRNVHGTIKIIKNDTVFVKIYQIGFYATEFGFGVLDTIATFLRPFPFKDITSIKVYRKTRFIRRNIGSMLMIGGGGYAGLNTINGLTNGETIFGKENLPRLRNAATAMGLGFIINKFFPVNRYTTKRDVITYINMNEEKKQ
jgi:uncharacterized membrane protein YidH (DUF202 family)